MKPPLARSHPRAPVRSAPAAAARRFAPPGFSLVELLVVVAVIAMLLSILLPGLAAARAAGRETRCLAALRQLGAALHLYAADFSGAAMPAAYTDAAAVAAAGGPIYWWGVVTESAIRPEHGPLWRYLTADLRTGGALECPDQPPGSFDDAQALPGIITSTYGYNGYYLTPAQTPGWSMQIGRRPWQRLETVIRPPSTFAFADTLLDLGGRSRNVALLDPPTLYSNGRWSANGSPTTAFRHRGRAMAAGVDGHAAGHRPAAGALTSPPFGIGSVSRTNDPHYVPDWRAW